MRADPIGLYVHVPLCLRKCNYCDFCSFTDISGEDREMYIKSLIDEICEYKGQNIKADTIFFGGGTPSLLSIKETERIFDALNSCFLISPRSEITIEANPKTVTKEKLSSLISLGVNRVSMGMQSIHDNELKILGRIHTYDDFLNSYSIIRASGIENVNIDLMYGIPEQNETSFLKTLDAVISLSPEHLSLYSLILEEGTPLYSAKDTLRLPSEDEDVAFYNLAVSALHNAGYHHYEISNYAKEGYQSKHNLKYWRASEYLGFGPAAYSYYNGERFGNTKNLSEYFNKNTRRSYSELISDADRKFEYVMLKLRLSEGFSISEYRTLFGKGPEFIDGDYFKDLVKNGFINNNNGRISLTDKGMYVSNTILSELL